MTIFTRTLVASALSVGLLAGGALPAMAKELKLSLLLPEHHVLVQRVFKPFEQEVEEKSGGELEITLYPSAVLGAGKEQLRLTETGVADIALVVPTYTRGRFPYLESGTLPFAFDSAEQGTNVLISLNDSYIEPEFDTVKLLFAAMTSPTAILTADKSLAQLTDLQGVTLRGTGGEQNAVLSELGVNPVSVSASEIYVAMERGTIEGTVLSLASAPGYKLEELTKYVNRVNFSSTPITVVMNQSAWDGLTPEQQQIIRKAAANAAIATGQAYDGADSEALDKLVAAGAQVVNFGAEDIVRLKAIAAPSWGNWEEKLNEAGRDGAVFMADFRKAIDSQ
jgi:TRAP-type C4-dicarboxylate transport system substrate-binding protein